MPDGVNSGFRYWGKEHTLIGARGKGAYIWDIDGNRYIDYRMGFGPVILGHAYPAVNERVREALNDGNLFVLTTPCEIDAAERIGRLAQMDLVRLSNTGTEVTMYALRLARGYTGRDKFIKFEGQYHGQVDYFLFSTSGSKPELLGPRSKPVNVPGSTGIPETITDYVICLPFNDLELLEETVEAHWQDLAAIVVEPILGNCAGILPKPGFLEKIRELCTKYGIVMILDEVKTGFRVAKGGAQEYLRVRGDLVTYAKAMANGFPIAAFAGTNEVMSAIKPGGVAHGGTYNGNVVVSAAASATLEILETLPIHETIDKHGRSLINGLDSVLTDAGIPHVILGPPSMFGVVLGTDVEPTDYREYHQLVDAPLYRQLIMELMERGVMQHHDAREPWFVSYSHDEQIIAETLQIFDDAVKAVKNQI